jgi:hypothetical protein
MIFLTRVLNNLLSLRKSGFSPIKTYYNPIGLLIQFVPDPRFEEVKKFVRSGVFGPYNYDELIGSLEGNEGFGRADYFLVGKDFPSYLECQEEVDKAYHDQKVSIWTFSYFMSYDFLTQIFFCCNFTSPNTTTKTKPYSTMCSHYLLW